MGRVLARKGVSFRKRARPCVRGCGLMIGGMALWEGACPGERDHVIRGCASLWEGFFPEEEGVSL